MSGRAQAVYPTFRVDAAPAAATYARHVGRIGALAVALGVGVAVATGHGVAVAHAEGEAGTTDSTSAGASNATMPSDPSPGATASTDADGTAASTATSAPHPSTATDPTSPTEVSGSSTGTDMNFSSTGGAHTSGADEPTPTQPAAPTTSVAESAAQPADPPAAHSDPVRTGSRTSNPSAVPAVAESTTTAAIVRVAAPAPATDSTPVEPVDPAATESAVVVATALAAAPEVDAPQQPAPATTVATSLLAAAISPFALPGPAGPVQSPLLWAILAWTRRESLAQTASASALTPEPPVAYNDIFDTYANTPVSGNVLVDDYVDPNAGPLVVDSFTAPQFGTVTWNANGDFTYTPSLGYLGPDEFGYTVRDALGASAVGVISIAVLAPNHAPVAVEDEYQIPNDRVLGGNLLSNDGDLDGPPIFVSAYTRPAHGTVDVDTAGGFTYTPVAGFVGTDSFTYTIADPARATSTATVNVTVVAGISAAQAVADHASTRPNDAVTIDVVANDYDANGDPFTGRPVLQTPPASGTVTVNADGTLTYTPNAGFYGDDGFAYSITDDRGYSAVGTVTVRVVNAAPIAGGDVYSTLQGGTLTIDAARGVLSNDVDLDGDQFSVASYGQAGHGTVAMSPDGAFTYIPDAGFFGADEFTYVVADSLGAKDETRVSVVVNQLPDLAPTAMDDVVDATGDTPVTFDPTANDWDPEGTPLTAKILTKPRYGGLAVNADGTFTYTPKTGFLGTDAFDYQVSDGVHTVSATVTITVAAADKPPIARDDAVTVPYLDQVIVYVLKNDTDPERGYLYVSDYGTPAHGSTGGAPGGAIEYTPDADFVGTDTFTYTVTDEAGNSSTATVTVTVLPPNRPPEAVDDAVTIKQDTSVVIDVLANDVDPDGDPLVVEIDTPPDYGTVTVGKDGAVEYTPPAGFVGTDYFNYTVTDPDGRISYASVAVTVTGEDGDPQEPEGKWFTVAAGDTLTVEVTRGLLAGHPEFDGWYAAVATKPAHGTLTLEADGSFTYTPATGFVGRDTFAFMAVTGEAADGPFTVTVDVTPTGVLASGGVGAGSGTQACQGNWLAKLYVPGNDPWWCSFPEGRPPSEL